MVEVMIRLIGTKQLDMSDRFPYSVEISRVPIENEFIQLPDDMGRWQVVEVVYDYPKGLAFEPVTVVTCCKPHDVKRWRDSRPL